MPLWGDTSHDENQDAQYHKTECPTLNRVSGVGAASIPLEDGVGGILFLLQADRMLLR